MQRYIANRLIWLILVLIGVTLLTFTMTNLIPADPARAAAGLDARAEQVEEIRKDMGLDKPLYVQYFSYIWRLLHGDLGMSSRSRRPVLKDLASYFPATMELAIATMIIYTLVGVPLGIVGAIKRGTLLDRLLDAFSIVGVAMPQFWLALMFQLILFGRLGWFPSSGRLPIGLEPPARVTGMYVVDSLLAGDLQTVLASTHHLCLPALTLALGSIGNVTRVARRSMIGVLGTDYVRTARAKGLRERAVIWKHAFKNALIPVITILGLQIGSVLSGAVLVEIVFAWPGIGKYLFDSIAYIDFQPIMGTTLLIAFVFVLANLIVDIAYVAIDPRITYS